MGLHDDAIYINSSGSVGIGTASPASKFDVAGGIKVANDAAACVTGKAGTLRYTGGSPPWQYCDGSGWVPFETAGSSGTQTVTIASNQSNVNLFHAAGFPTAAADWEFVINSGVTISSLYATAAAIVTGTFPNGSTIKITNNGNVYGKGGNAGNGGDSGYAGASGVAGGNAMELNFAVTIDNTNGNIYGAGGGGGGGGSAVSRTNCGGGGGGGGQGDDDGLLGAGGTAAGGNGAAGTTGTTASAGSGGAGNTACITKGGNGGNGGAWATAGSNGASATYSGGTGGAAGKAINTNGNSVTWLGGNNGAQVKGAVN